MEIKNITDKEKKIRAWSKESKKEEEREVSKEVHPCHPFYCLVTQTIVRLIIPKPISI